MKNRSRVDAVRYAVLAALSGQRRPDAVTAALVSLLQRVGGLAAVLDINDEGLRRAGEITVGPRGTGSNTAEVNLALTAAAVLPALD